MRENKWWTVTYCGPFGVMWMSYKSKASALKAMRRLKDYQPRLSYGEHFPC